MIAERVRWKNVTLGDLFEIKHGYAFKGEYFGTKGTHVVLTPGNFFDEGGFKKKGDKEKWYSGEIPTDYILKKGDLLVAMTEQAEGLLGSAAIVPKSDLYLHNQRLGLIQNLRGIDSRFLYYIFNSAPVRQQIRSSCSGVKVRHTSPSRISEVKVPIPSLPIQRKIAGILSAYDDLIENNLRRIKILEEMAQSLYREWFVHFRFPGHESVKLMDSALGQIPKGWEAGRLDQFVFLQRGFDITKKDQQEGPYPVVSSSGPSSFHAEFKVTGPGVVIGRKGALGTVHYQDSAFWPHDTTLWVKEFRRGSALSAFYLLREMDLGRFDTGAAVPTLNRNNVHCLPVTLPPEPLLRKFDEIAVAIHEHVGVLQQKNQTLRSTRDLLLPKLLSSS